MIRGESDRKDAMKRKLLNDRSNGSNRFQSSEYQSHSYCESRINDCGLQLQIEMHTMNMALIGGDYYVVDGLRLEQEHERSPVLRTKPLSAPFYYRPFNNSGCSSL